jgi:hypothetical protein
MRDDIAAEYKPDRYRGDACPALYVSMICPYRKRERGSSTVRSIWITYQLNALVKGFHEYGIIVGAVYLDTTVEDYSLGDYPAVHFMYSVIEYYCPVWGINRAAYNRSGVIEMYTAVLRIDADSIRTWRFICNRIIEHNIVLGKYSSNS